MENSASKVLIVDDMPINCMILSSLLATNGVSSDQAGSGMECLELCENNDYDLILLDHLMPELDGVDTFVKLKEIFEKKGRTVPVVCHTTEQGRSNINLYKAAGFADVLIKPIDLQQLSAVLMTYLPEEDKITNEEEKKLSENEAEVSESSEPGDVKEELLKLPIWLKTVPHIDLALGITNCESAEDYMDALYVFYSSIEEKAEEISSAFNNEDWTMYTLRVHSLKSMASLVGAKKLSEAARTLESAAREADHATVREYTQSLLTSYRDFMELLSPIEDEARTLNKESEKKEEKRNEQERPDNGKTVLFIQSNNSIVVTGIENNLEKAGFKVINIPDEPDVIISRRFDADLVLYLPNISDGSHIGLTMNLLGEICQDDSKILCLTGDVADIDLAMGSSGAYRVAKCYPRPVEITQFINDMKEFSHMESEYHRKKTLFVVDDDPDYLSVIKRWLSEDYNVSGFSCGKDLLTGLSTAMPDLILLDYEMPEMDGYDLMKNVRENEETKEIPIIFLTGKNDRDHVYRILGFKPDGYLLKTSRKEALLDAIGRFFTEYVFKGLTEND